MNRLFFLLSCVIATCFSAGAQNKDTKCGIKSAIVEYRISVMGIKGKNTMMIDDYGDKITDIISMMGVNVRKYVLKDTKEILTINFDDKTVEIKPHEVNNYLRFTDEEKLKYDFKEEGDEQYLGKVCKKVSWKKDGEKKVLWVWKGIILKSINIKNGVITRVEATELNENVEIDQAEFELPDFAVAELERQHISR